MSEHEGPVVVMFPTIMDGVVVRWYRGLAAAEAHRCSISASRGRVCVHDDDFQTLPRVWIEDAMRVHHALKRDPRTDVSAWVTHNARFGRDELTPIKSEATP